MANRSGRCRSVVDFEEFARTVEFQFLAAEQLNFIAVAFHFHSHDFLSFEVLGHEVADRFEDELVGDGAAAAVNFLDVA